MANRWGNNGNGDRLYFLGLQNHCRWGDGSHEVKRHLFLWKKAMTNLDSILKSRDITLSIKFHLVKALVFPVLMYGCESCTIKKADAFELWLEKTLESLLDCKEIKPVHPQGNQSWIFIGGTDAEAEAPILWPPDAKNWLIWKYPDARKDWRQEEKGLTEDEMVGWHHWLNGHEFEQAPGVGDGQGSLACCSPWGCRVGHDWATELNWVPAPTPMGQTVSEFMIFRKVTQCVYYVLLLSPIFGQVPHNWMHGNFCSERKIHA